MVRGIHICGQTRGQRMSHIDFKDIPKQLWVFYKANGNIDCTLRVPVGDGLATPVVEGTTRVTYELISREDDEA